MALLGELQGYNGVKCSCGQSLPLEVCQSAAGYYLGYTCPNCGPYSRETGYYKTYEAAKSDLDLDQPENVRMTEYQPEELTIEVFETKQEIIEALSSSTKEHGHTWTVHENCQVNYCPIREGGLALCKACGCLEGSLPSECPGFDCYKEYGDRIYRGEIDFQNGQWVENPSRFSPAYYRQEKESSNA